MRPGRFVWGAVCLGSALGLVTLALALEHTAFFKSLVGGLAYLVTFSALCLGGVGLMWSDVGRSPLKWAGSVGATLVVAAYHLLLFSGPG